MSNEHTTSPPSPSQTHTTSPPKSTPQFSRHIYNPPSIYKPAPTYSHIAIIPLSTTARLITIAGQIGIDLQGNIPPDFARQVELALDNLEKCLASARCGKGEIVKVTLYIVARPSNKVDGEVRRSLFATFWGELQPPPSTLVYVAALGLPQLLFEVEAMVVGKM